MNFHIFVYTISTVLQERPSVRDIWTWIGGKIGADWRQFGTYLGIQSSELKKLRKDNPHSVDDCCLHMVENWMEKMAGYGEFPRTWDTVLNATKESGHRSLSMEVREILLKRK